MRDTIEDWISRGGNAAFFSGNSVCWQTRTEDDGHAYTCWKQNYSMDPAYQGAQMNKSNGVGMDFEDGPEHSLITSLWSHRLVARCAFQSRS